jgi:electron transfer flavoprotein alpha subunit
MGKTIGLKQLAQKVYAFILGLPQEITDSFGKLEDAFDMVLFGASGNGKSNAIAKLLMALLRALKCRAHYVAYEEGHGATIQEMMIHRHNMLEELGNVLQVTDHMTFAELMKAMDKRKSAKIWIIDSIQAARLTGEQCAELKRKFVLSRKRKIIIYVSWAEGKFPQGSAAKSVEYYANVKVRVEGLIAFVRSRYGGNKNYVIWEEGAKKYWGLKLFNKHKNR